MLPHYMAALLKEIEGYQQKPPFDGFSSSSLPEIRQQQQVFNDGETAASPFLAAFQTMLPDDGFSLSSIYFGGGTPSLLSHEQIFTILRFIRQGFYAPQDIEITLEANPGTLSEPSAALLLNAGINRLSLGVQSFDNRDLSMLSRIHDARQAAESIHYLQRANIPNISIDLIYAVPCQTLDSWQQTVTQTLQFKPQHISMYGLTYEPGTALARAVELKQIKKCDEELEREMYLCGSEMLTAAGYEHYEISNFALPGYRSRHNQKYWDGTAYLGLGPSAHSHFNHFRWRNIDDVHAYHQRLNKDEWPVAETEKLTTTQMKAEAILLGLRRKEGLDLQMWRQIFTKDFYELTGSALESLGGIDLDTSPFQPSQNGKLLTGINHHLALTRQGLLLYDYICRELYAAVA